MALSHLYGVGFVEYVHSIHVEEQETCLNIWPPGHITEVCLYSV